jgi:hypothetical protein
MTPTMAAARRATVEASVFSSVFAMIRTLQDVSPKDGRLRQSKEKVPPPLPSGRRTAAAASRVVEA